MQAIEVTEFGDRDVIETTDRDVPEPGPGEVRVDVEARIYRLRYCIASEAESTDKPHPQRARQRE